MGDRIMKTALLSLGSILLCSSLVQAQTILELGNSIQNSSSQTSIPVNTVIQPNFLIDSVSSSQQFFRGGRDSFYFLPAENTKPILKIDQTFDFQEVDQEEINKINPEEKSNK